jgi:hypothetical protein
MAGKGKPFVLGKSGNPFGRPVGARNKTTLAVEALFDGEAEALTRKAVEMAKAGDVTAMRLCLERIVPARKDRPVNFALPPIKSASDLVKAIKAVAAAVANGELTLSEAGEMSKIVDSFMRAVELTEFEDRLSKLEATRSGS